MFTYTDFTIHFVRSQSIPLHIRELVAEKRTCRRWQRTRNPLDKTSLNRLTHQLRTSVQSARNDIFRDYITNLCPEDHSLWKATKKFKRPTIATRPIRTPDRTWARSDQQKVNIFAEHVAKVFSPAEDHNIDRAEILNFLVVPCQLSLPVRFFSPNEVHQELLKTNLHKAPGFELIVCDMLKHLRKKATVLLTRIYNSMLRLCHYPIEWKLAQVIKIAKPGKPPTDASSYRPISLLRIMTKTFERLL
jgi:hypothetical protein